MRIPNLQEEREPSLPYEIPVERDARLGGYMKEKPSRGK